MPRLVAFGCSFTYGHGLPDCHIAPDLPGLTASKLAWPQLVADQLNLTCVNLSKPGISNKRIWRDLVEFDRLCDDVICVMWTEPSRSCLFEDQDTCKDIGSWMPDVSYYQHCYSDYDADLQSRLFISHGNLIMDRPIYNLIKHSKLADLFQSWGRRIPHIPVYFDFFDQFSMKALDQKHPGQECHQMVADRIVKFI